MIGEKKKRREKNYRELVPIEKKEDEEKEKSLMGNKKIKKNSGKTEKKIRDKKKKICEN